MKPGATAGLFVDVIRTINGDEAQAESQGPSGGIDVCSWYIADVPLVLTNVCFEGTSGHDAGLTSFQLLTQRDELLARHLLASWRWHHPSPRK